MDIVENELDNTSSYIVENELKMLFITNSLSFGLYLIMCFINPKSLSITSFRIVNMIDILLKIRCLICMYHFYKCFKQIRDKTKQ